MNAATAWLHALTSALLGEVMSCWPIAIPALLVGTVGVFTWKYAKKALSILHLLPARPIAPVSLVELVQGITDAHTKFATDQMCQTYASYVFSSTGQVAGVKKALRSVVVTITAPEGFTVDLKFTDNGRPADGLFALLRPGVSVTALGTLNSVNPSYIQLTNCEFRG